MFAETIRAPLRAKNDVVLSRKFPKAWKRRTLNGNELYTAYHYRCVSHVHQLSNGCTGLWWFVVFALDVYPWVLLLQPVCNLPKPGTH